MSIHTNTYIHTYTHRYRQTDKHAPAFWKDWRRVGTVAEVVDSVPICTEPQAGPPAPHALGLSVHAGNASIQDTRQEDQTHKIILGYTGSSRLA